MNGVLFGHDEMVARWAFATHKIRPMQVCMAVGLMNPVGQPVGAVLFQNYNGNNVDLSYYGVNTLTLGIARTMAKIVLHQFNASRVTILTSKKNKSIIKFLPRLGCRFEGTARCFYGPEDNVRNTAMRFVLFREQVELLAQESIVTRKVS